MELLGSRARRVRMAGATALAVVLLGACGDGGAPDTGAPTSAEPSETVSPSTSETPSAEAEPSKSETIPPNTRACSEVWREGARIPRIYFGCMEQEAFVEREGRPCSSGQRLLHYRNFYGVAGGTVIKGTKPLGDDPGFERAAVECVA